MVPICVNVDYKLRSISNARDPELAVQSSEPGFESPFANVSKIGHSRSLN